MSLMKTAKICSKCGVKKNNLEYSKNKAQSDGLNVWCRVCQTAYRKKWYIKNKEKELASTRHWRERNREEYNKYQSEYQKKNRAKNRAKATEYQRRWRKRKQMKKLESDIVNEFGLEKPVLGV